jgi:prephenate dehydratase
MIIRINNYDCQKTAKEAVENGECDFALIPFMNEEGGAETQILVKGEMAQKLRKKIGERMNGKVPNIFSVLFLRVSSNQAENFIRDTFSHLRL